MAVHKDAIEWDRKHGYDSQSKPSSDLPRPPKGFVPKNRPCDVCGLKVRKGYIHTDCMAGEAL